MKKKIAIFCGGKSLEHEISIITAFEILNSLSEDYDGFIVYLDKNNKMYTGPYLQVRDNYRNLKKIICKGKEVRIVSQKGKYYLISKFKKVALFDVAYLGVHGKGIEDGTLTAIMEYYDIPYVGNNILSSAIGQDKWLAKFLLHSANIPILPCFYIDSINYQEKYIEKKVNNIGFPLIVKANHLGSSIGLKKIDTMGELYDAIELLSIYDNKILIEKYLDDFKEINQAITIQNNEDILSSVEVIYPNLIFNYDDKYLHSNVKKEICSDKTLIEKISKLTCKIYHQLGLNSIVRIDYLYDLTNDKIYFSEINTIPGSLARRLFENKGIFFDELLSNEIEKAISYNFREKNKIRVLKNDVMKNILNIGSKK